MKVYRVVLVDGVWCAFTRAHEPPVICCEDKSILVECARALARKHNGQVHIYNEMGHLDLVHSFGEIRYQAE
jgi:hypothetical protein